MSAIKTQNGGPTVTLLQGHPFCRKSAYIAEINDNMYIPPLFLALQILDITEIPGG
jgi:hypothetical protein